MQVGLSGHSLPASNNKQTRPPTKGIQASAAANVTKIKNMIKNSKEYRRQFSRYSICLVVYMLLWVCALPSVKLERALWRRRQLLFYT